MEGERFDAWDHSQERAGIFPSLKFSLHYPRQVPGSSPVLQSGKGYVNRNAVGAFSIDTVWQMISFPGTQTACLRD